MKYLGDSDLGSLVMGHAYHQKKQETRRDPMATATTTATGIMLQLIAAPSLRCIPLRVRVMQMCREMRALAAEILRSRFQEKPPRFIDSLPP